MFSKAGIPPADAIAQICQPAATLCGDCYIAASLCVWWGQYQALGPTAFNTKWTGRQLNTYVALKPTATDAYKLKMFYSVPGPVTVPFTTPTRGPRLVPGDWTYFKNYNYGEIIEAHTFDANGNLIYTFRRLLDPGSPLEWSGENALLSEIQVNHVMGENDWAETEIYSGLGAGCDSVAEADFRDNARTAYNTDLAPLFPRGLNIGGAPIQALNANPVDDLKLQFIDNLRIHLGDTDGTP